MATTKEIKGRLVLKHDTAANWKTAGEKGFCPLANEIIMFDPDDSCAMIRYKIGRWANDDKTELTNINDLPFEANLMYVEQQLTDEQKKVARENIGAISVEISETPKDGEILVYDAATNKLVNSGWTFKTFYDKIIADVKTWIATEEVIEDNDAGGQTATYSAPPESVASVANEQGGDTLMIGGIE